MLLQAPLFFSIGRPFFCVSQALPEARSLESDLHFLDAPGS
jgi:hypothetical protein